MIIQSFRFWLWGAAMRDELASTSGFLFKSASALVFCAGGWANVNAMAWWDSVIEV